MITVLAGLSLTVGEVSAQVAIKNVPFSTPHYSYTLLNDVVYGQAEINGGGSFTDLTMDLYIPDIPDTEYTINTLPLMVMIHGGGFTAGSKNGYSMVSQAPGYAERGWLVASINYRLAGDDPVLSSRMQPLYDAVGGANAPLLTRSAFAAVDDTLSALDFLHARDDIHDAWTTLWGASAGAYVALIVGYCMDEHGIARPPIAAVIDNSGSVRACRRGTPFDDPGGSDPVLMVVHSPDDASVPYSAATDLRTWAVDAGLPLDFHDDTAGHVPDLFNYYTSEGVSLYQRTVDFQHETVFEGLEQGPQRPTQLPPGC